MYVAFFKNYTIFLYLIIVEDKDTEAHAKPVVVAIPTPIQFIVVATSSVSVVYPWLTSYCLKLSHT